MRLPLIVYNQGFSINEIFNKSSSGIQTEFDELVTHISQKKAKTILFDLKSLDAEVFASKYGFQSKLNKIIIAKKDIISNPVSIQPIDYKIFNTQFCIYTGKTNGLMGRPRFEMMKNIISKNNISICLLRSLVDTTTFSSIFISNKLVDKNFYGFQTSIFPLHLYPDEKNKDLFAEGQARTPNLNSEIVEQIAVKLGLRFTNEKEKTAGTFAPIDILDYIYAVLHSPTYREKYKEFLKIDFPRVPYPKAAEVFWQLVKLGGELRQLHLLESDKVEDYLTQYPIDGDNVVEKPKYENGKVYINETQYFDNVPQVAWEFYIGGYQPAQKWLKDRKGRALEFDDILHYQKIIVALSETDRLMQEIDGIEI